MVLQSTDEKKALFKKRFYFAVDELGLKPDASVANAAFQTKDTEFFDDLLDKYKIMEFMKPPGREFVANEQYIMGNELYTLFFDKALDEKTFQRLFSGRVLVEYYSKHNNDFLPNVLNCLTDRKRWYVLRELKHQTALLAEWDKDFDPYPGQPMKTAARPLTTLMRHVSTVEEIDLLNEVSRGGIDWARNVATDSHSSTTVPLVVELMPNIKTTDVIDKLHSLGVDINHVEKPSTKSSLLHLAAHQENLPVFQHLLEHYKMDPNVKNGKGLSALELVDPAKTIGKAITSGMIATLKGAKVGHTKQPKPKR